MFVIDREDIQKALHGTQPPPQDPTWVDIASLRTEIGSLKARIVRLEGIVETLPDEIIRRLADGLKSAPSGRARVME